MISARKKRPKQLGALVLEKALFRVDQDDFTRGVDLLEEVDFRTRAGKHPEKRLVAEHGPQPGNDLLFGFVEIRAAETCREKSTRRLVKGIDILLILLDAVLKKIVEGMDGLRLGSQRVRASRTGIMSTADWSSRHSKASR